MITDGRSLGRIAYGATYDGSDRPQSRPRPSEEDIDATWKHLDQTARDLWEHIAECVVAANYELGD